MHKNYKKGFLGFLRQWYIFIILAALYIPLILIVLLSFTGQTSRGNIIYNNFAFKGFNNYWLLFENDEFDSALLHTIILGITVTPISVLIATITCFGIWKSKTAVKRTTMATSQFAIINPDSITGVSLALLFTSTWVALGFNFGFFTVLMSHVSFCVPYAIIAIYPRMAKMNPNLINASYDLGHTKLSTFMKVTVPYLMPALLSAAAIAFAMSFDDFVITNLVNGSYQTVATLIYTSRKGIKAWIITFGAIIILLTFVIVIITIVAKAYRIKKINKQNMMRGAQV